MYNNQETVSTVIAAPANGSSGVTVTAHTTSAPTSKDPATKADFFYLLYQFGHFYLQVNPNKVAGFLEYLGFLTKECKEFSVAGISCLDCQIRSQYINHPDWNWEQSRSEVSRVFHSMKGKAENLLPGSILQVAKNSSQTHPSKSNNTFYQRRGTNFNSSFCQLSARPPPPPVAALVVFHNSRNQSTATTTTSVPKAVTTLSVHVYTFVHTAVTQLTLPHFAHKTPHSQITHCPATHNN